ncbi:MAG: hypothetical protein SF070_01910 [Gemmatimonadota bacterium]|nr:hypothetical protein [Gemmatimonadota bacterium]
MALLLPYSLGIVGILGAGRHRPAVHQFLLLGHGLALAQFLLWSVWQGGFPQFSDVWGL